MASESPMAKPEFGCPNCKVYVKKYGTPCQKHSLESPKPAQYAGLIEKEIRRLFFRSNDRVIARVRRTFIAEPPRK